MFGVIMKVLYVLPRIPLAAQETFQRDHINCKNLNYFTVCTLFSSYREMLVTQLAEIFLF